MSSQNNRFSLILVLLLYFVPIFAWMVFSYMHASVQESLFTVAGGLSILFLGAPILYSLIRLPPQPVLEPSLTIKEPVEPVFISPQPPAEDPRRIELESLVIELETKVNELTKTLQEKNFISEGLEEELEQLRQQLQECKTELIAKDEEFRIKKDDLEQQMHQKQQILEQLETQIHDLRYEIKTLLQLTEVDYSRFVMEQPKEDTSAPSSHTPFYGVVKREEEAKALLKRCLEVAQKISSGYRASSQNLGGDPSALELRRLTDALKEQSGALVLLYDPSERRMLYASKESKNMLGWAPESFAHQFVEIAEEGLAFWETAVSQLSAKPQSSLVMGLKTKGGDELAFNAILGSISVGIFRSYAIAVLYPQ